MPSGTCSSCGRTFSYSATQFAPMFCPHCRPHVRAPGIPIPVPPPPRLPPRPPISSIILDITKEMPSHVRIIPAEECAMCFDKMNVSDACVIQCGHVFHIKCLQNIFNHSLPSAAIRCPYCRKVFDKDKIYQIPGL